MMKWLAGACLVANALLAGVFSYALIKDPADEVSVVAVMAGLLSLFIGSGAVALKQLRQPRSNPDGESIPASRLHFLLPFLGLVAGAWGTHELFHRTSSEGIAERVREEKEPRGLPSTTTLDGGQWRVEPIDQRPILVHAWSTSHDGSLGMLVRLQFLKKILGDDAPIRFLGIVMETSESEAKQVVDALGIDWPQIREVGNAFDGDVARAFRLTKYGRANFVNTDGSVRRSNMSGTRLTSRMKSDVRKLSLMGKDAPQIETTSLDGEPWSLAERRGKVVVIDFWATWCGPCKKEIPNLKALHAEHSAREDFELVGISLDEDEEDLRSYLKAAPLPWSTLFEAGKGFGNAAAKDYGVTSIPTLYVIGKDGTVVSTGRKGEELQDFVRGLLDGA